MTIAEKEEIKRWINKYKDNDLYLNNSYQITQINHTNTDLKFIF